MDGHICLNGNYEEALLQSFIEQAIKEKQDEIIILEPASIFKEYASLYKEVRAVYPCQRDWYDGQNLCSVSDYHAFILAMRKKQFPLTVRFGICADYFTQHESLLTQMKAHFPYDRFVGRIHFIDNIAFDWEPQSREMLWNKYNTSFLYRRYYEMMHALITSQLFDGVSGFDDIQRLQIKPRFSLSHTYHKLAMLLALHHMYVEENIDEEKGKGKLSEQFRTSCEERHIIIVPCSYRNIGC